MRTTRGKEGERDSEGEKEDLKSFEDKIIYILHNEIRRERATFFFFFFYQQPERICH